MWRDYITLQSESQSNPVLLLLAVALPPQSLEALGPLIEERTVETAFGVVGPLARRGLPEGPSVWIQPYYGLPSRTDPRATLQAAQKLKAGQVLAWDSGIAVNPLLGPGDAMLITDYIDFTRHQPQTLLEGEGSTVAARTPPVCPRLTEQLSRLLPAAPAGVYLGVDGPRRETAAEARMFRAWGADAIGQNLVPEIALAGELGICFAGLVTIEDFSSEQPSHPDSEQMTGGLEAVVQAFSLLLHSQSLSLSSDCGCNPAATASR